MITDKIPFLALSVCFGVLGAYSQVSALRSGHLSSFLNQFLIPSYAVIFYLGKILLPMGLSSLYPYSGIKDPSIYLFSLVGCLAIFILTSRSARYSKKIVFSVLFFLITLLPVLQFVRLGFTIVADRYMYMASIGLFYLIAEGIVWIYKKTAEKNRRLSVALALIFLIPLIGCLSVLTWNRCAVWKDGITLWSDVLKIYPSTFAYNQRGILFYKKGEYAKARYDFEKGIASNTAFISTYLNLGNLYNAMGKSDEAIATFKKILALEPKNAEAYFNIGHIYALLGRNAEAASFYEKTLEIDRNHAMGCYFLGLLRERMGKKDDALRMLSRALETAPGFLVVYPKLAQLYEEAGKKTEKFALYRQAVTHDVPFYDAYYAIGNFDLEHGDVKSAIRMFQRAVEIYPSSAEGYVSLGSAYCLLGQTKRAISLLNKALGMDPKIAVAHNNIAVAYYHQKQYALAIQHCDKAIEMGYKVTPKLLGLLKPFRK